MKIQIFKVAFAGLTLALLPLVNGCDAESADAAIVADPPTDVVDETGSEDKAQSTALPEAPKELAANPEAAPVDPDQKTLPANLSPHSAAGEIARMAQAGVDQGVLLAYVTNSQKVFGLTSDEIVYLNDLGVPGGVITAVIEHDKAMKEFWANSAQPQTPPPTFEPEPTQVEQTASAPSYVNPPEAQPEPTTVVNENYFYDTLSPYGTWISIEGYGRCWQPTVVVGNAGWRPYCDRGRWIYTDCGWYWMSDYSWGSAAFHYGRWFNHPRWGWCWWPDNVWGPSWVTWRSGDEYCGWAPLPPAAVYAPGYGFSYYGSSVGIAFGFGLSSACYTFVPTTHFCDPHPWRYCAPHSTATRIYNNTTVINNFGSRNHTVVNRGIDPNHIRSVSKTEIRQVAVREAKTPAGRGIRTDRLERDGRTLTVSRPQFASNQNTARGDKNLTAGQPTSGDPTRRIETPRDGGAGAGANNPPVRDHSDQGHAARPRAGFLAANDSENVPGVTPPPGARQSSDVPGVTPPAGASTRNGEVPGVTPPSGARSSAGSVPGVTRPAGARPTSEVPGVTPPAGAHTRNGEVPGVTPPSGANSTSGVPGVTRPVGARPGSDVPGVTLPSGARTRNGEVPGVTPPPGARPPSGSVPGVTRPAGARQNSDVPGVTSPAGARSLSSGVPGVTPPAGARQDSSVPGVTPPAGARTPADSVPGVTLPTRPSAPAASGFADNSGRTPANWSAQTRGSQVPPLIVIGSQTPKPTIPTETAPAPAQADSKESGSSMHVIGRITPDSSARNRYQIYESSRSTPNANNNVNNGQSSQGRSTPQVAEGAPATEASRDSRPSGRQFNYRSESYRSPRNSDSQPQYSAPATPRAPIPVNSSPAPSQSQTKPSPPPQSQQSSPRSQPQSQSQSQSRSDNGSRGRN